MIERMSRWLALAIVLVACGADEVVPGPDYLCDGDFQCGRDGSVDGFLGHDPTYPGGQQNCLTGQKATWIVVQETPERLGKIGCVPDGTVAEGGSCTFGPPGETSGFDNCAAGFVCSAGICADICSLDPLAPAISQCATGTCTVDPALFANGMDDPVAGVCR
jgi:hypothetical protein